MPMKPPTKEWCEAAARREEGHEVGVGSQVAIDVPGCTCAERSQEQLDRADVCGACVSYFDLEGTD